MCNNFLGCVLLDPTKLQNKLQPSSTEDSPLAPSIAGFSEFRASSPETREREKSMSVKIQHKE